MHFLFSILANLPSPSAGELYVWLVCATCVVVVVNQVKQLLHKEPPDHRRYADRVETSDRMNKFESRLLQMETENKASEQRILQAGQERADMLRAEFRASVGKTHARIDAMVEKIGQLVGELKGRHS